MQHITADRINWPDHLPKAIAFDIDGTLSDNTTVMRQLNGKPLRGSCKFGKPVREVVRAMHRVRKLGYALAIFTARAKSEEKALVCWLNKHRIPYDHLWVDQKPPFILLVDDRVVDVKRKSWFQNLKSKLHEMSSSRNGKRRG